MRKRGPSQYRNFLAYASGYQKRSAFELLFTISVAAVRYNKNSKPLNNLGYRGPLKNPNYLATALSLSHSPSQADLQSLPQASRAMRLKIYVPP